MAELKKILGYPANDIDKILQQSVYSVADDIERDGLSKAIKTTYRTIYVRGTGKFYHWENEAWNEDKSGSVVLDDKLSSTSENGVQNKVITKAINEKQDKLRDDATIQYFSGDNDKFYIFLGTLNIGDYFWLEGLTGKVLTRTGLSTVTGKILMQLVSGLSTYTMPKSGTSLGGTPSISLKNCYHLLAKGFIYKDIYEDAKYVMTPSRPNTIHKYNLTAELDNTKEYELYFAEQADVNDQPRQDYFYSFAGISTRVQDNISKTRVITRLDATNEIAKNNDIAVTSGAVYTALGNKQDKLTDTQLAAVNSGITSIDKTQIATNKTDIATLQTGKQDKLTAGENITIENNVISAKGGDLSNYYTKSEIDAMLPFSEDISGGNS